MSSLPTATLRVASIPFAAQRGAIEHNVEHVVARLEHAALDGVALAVFPEACLTGGIEEPVSSGLRKARRAHLSALATSVDSPLLAAVADAVERTGVAAGVGLIERGANGALHSSYAMYLPGGERHVHRKLQTDGQRHIACGDRFTVFDTRRGWRLAVLVGGDNYLVENARMAALLGAGLLVAPHAPSGATDAAGDVWMRRMLPARALDNGMFVVYCDGARRGEHESEDAAAAIVDPCGHIVAQGVRGGDMVVADLDPALIATSPGHRWLGARRPDLYARLSRDMQPAASARGGYEPRSASARGAVPISFAVVKRDAAGF
ncbi:nitrilase [Paraburkholderia sp. LEh10]|nr:nitrilase [Paraburkholderia sp. LEh10]